MNLVHLLIVSLLVFFVHAQQAQKFDHRAHSVPGPDQTVRDDDGDGFAEVTLNGELSHTHFFIAGPPAVVGKLVSYEWVERSLGAIIGTTMKVTYSFPVGRTDVTLTVVDNSGDVSANNVTVTVLPSGDQGAYMYFYDLAGVSTSAGSVPVIPNKPSYGTAVKSINFGTPAKFPDVPFISKGPFACKLVADFLAILEDDYVFFIAHGGGAIQFLVDGTTRINKAKASTKEILSVSKPIRLGKGKHRIDLMYYTADPSRAQLILGVNLNGGVQAVPATFLSYESLIVKPTLHSIDPPLSTLGAGGSMKLRGAGFTSGSTVTIGPYQVEKVYVKNDGEIDIIVPTASAPGDVLVQVTTSRGKSNMLHFSYTRSAQMPIKFKETYVMDQEGKPFPSEQFTTVAIGPDLRYYFGSLDTHVHVLTISHKKLVVQKSCKSTSMGDSRSITAVSFNPADRNVRVYISTNTFYWKNWGLMSDDEGWHNGKIETLVPGSNKNDDNICLVHEKVVVSGLPVSNHDHGVNGLVWDNDGNLYAQVGGFTNAGHSVPGDLMGGIPESVLSAATVVVHLGAPGFDGKVVYDQYTNPGTAKKISPDKYVEGWAYGFRNSYGSVYHSNGHIYATDNGPNEGYGKKSMTCSTEGKDPWHPDALFRLHKNGYYGFPNRARGQNGDPRQCVYYAPKETSRNGFTSALGTFEASTNGLIEYTANCFDGQLKGNLLASKYAVGGKGKLYRIALDATGTQVVGGVQELAQYSGLSIAMNPFGALIMPRVQQPNIAVLLPDEEDYEGELPKVTALLPNRGPKKGGNNIAITGLNFLPDTKVFFDGKPCEVRIVSPGNNWLLCRAPAGAGSVKVVVETSAGTTDSIGKDYYYLNY